MASSDAIVGNINIASQKQASQHCYPNLNSWARYPRDRTTILIVMVMATVIVMVVVAVMMEVSRSR